MSVVIGKAGRTTLEMLRQQDIISDINREGKEVAVMNIGLCKDLLRVIRTRSGN